MNQIIWVIIGGCLVAIFAGILLAFLSDAVSEMIKKKKAKRIAEGKEKNYVRALRLPGGSIEVKKQIVGDEMDEAWEVNLYGTKIRKYSKDSGTGQAETAGHSGA